MFAFLSLMCAESAKVLFSKINFLEFTVNSGIIELAEIKSRENFKISCYQQKQGPFL